MLAHSLYVVVVFELVRVRVRSSNLHVLKYSCWFL